MNDAVFMRLQARLATASAALAAVLWLGSVAEAPLRAQEAAADSTRSVPLQYRELPYTILNQSLSFSPQATAFPKEPNLAQRKVVRGTFKFGNSTEQFLPFLWDFTQGKLYLDLNRNHDLTDDAEGVFTHRDKSYGWNNYYQTFTNLHLSFKTPMGNHRALVDLHLHNYSNQPGGSIACRSFWEGKITLQGRDWQLGFVESLSRKFGSTEDSYLLLRPWPSREQAFNLDAGSLDGFRFSPNLFFGQQAYRADCAYVQQGDAPGFRIELKEQPAQLGQLELNGQFIHRLLLTGQGGKKPFTVVLDTPEPVVKIPVGSYSSQVYLQQGKAEAHRDPSGSPVPNRVTSLTVSATSPALLEIGGPLTNTVSVSRRGGDLSFNYQLVGARSEAYQLLGARQQPEFAVYKADKRIASGKFEFG